MKNRISLVVFAVSGMAGCDAGQDAGPLGPIELLDRGGSGALRIVLDPMGGARIDVMNRIDDGNRVFSHSVYVPCSDIEVERLSKALVAIHDSLAGPCDYPEFVNAEPARVFFIHVGGKERRLELSRAVIERNFLWDGLLRETEAVGHVQAALGIVSYLAAEHMRNKGDMTGASHEYDAAWKAALEWGRTRAARMPRMVIYEPEIRGLPFGLLGQAKASPKEAIDAFIKSWKLLTEEEFSMTTDGNMTVVSFLSTERGLSWGMRSRIKPEVLKRLRELTPSH